MFTCPKCDKEISYVDEYLESRREVKIDDNGTETDIGEACVTCVTETLCPECRQEIGDYIKLS